MEELVEQYLAFARDSTRYTAVTVKNYSCELRKFLRLFAALLQRPPTIEDFTLEELLRFDGSRQKAGLRPRSRYLTIYTLRAFGDWLVRHKHLTQNPAKQIRTPALDKPIRRAAKESDARALLDACGRLRGTDRQALARAVMSVFLFAGLRKAELLALHAADVDMQQNKLKVRKGKGSKYREIPMNTLLRVALVEWLKARCCLRRLPQLWTYTEGRALTNYTLDHLIDDLKIAAKLTDVNLTPHCFRRYFATMMHRRAVTLPTIQYLLGHENLQTTICYLQTDEEQITAAVELAIPSVSLPVAPIQQKPQKRLRRDLRR